MVGHARRVEMDFFIRYFWLVLLQRRKIVQRPERASMSCHEQVIAVDGEIVNGRDRQIALERFPMRTVIPGEKHAAFCAGIEQPFAFLVFAHSVNKSIGWETTRDGGPRLAEIGGLKDIRSKIIHFMALD